MREFIILTDSCCDFSAQMVEELELSVLPLSFIMEGKEYFNYPDNRDIAPGEFYRRLRDGTLGTTAAINVGTFHDAMGPGRGVPHLPVRLHRRGGRHGRPPRQQDSRGGQPGRLPGPGAAGVPDGAGEAEGPVHRGGAGLCGAHQGPHLPLVHRGGPHPKRGGRVSAAAALVGTMLQMKPVLHVDDEGHLIPVSKVRGRKASVKALLDKMDELVEDPSVVFISHGDCEEEAVALGEAIREKYPVERLEINYVGPVIGNHSGPGTLALFFQGKHK